MFSRHSLDSASIPTSSPSYRHIPKLPLSSGQEVARKSHFVPSANEVSFGYEKNCRCLVREWLSGRERNSGIDPRSPQSATTVIGELNIAHAKVLAGSNLKNSRLGEIKPTTLLALFRLYPALKLRAEEHDPTDPQTAILPPIERLEEIELCDFVGALSVAAIANWMPYRGTGSRLGIRVHPLNDPELVIARLKDL